MTMQQKWDLLRDEKLSKEVILKLDDVEVIDFYSLISSYFSQVSSTDFRAPFCDNCVNIREEFLNRGLSLIRY